MLDNDQQEKIQEHLDELERLLHDAPGVMDAVVEEARLYASARFCRSVGKRISKSNESYARVCFLAADRIDEVIKGDQLCMSLNKY